MGRTPALCCGLNCSQATLGSMPSSRMCVELSSVAFAQGPSMKEPSACGAALPALGAGAGACSASAQECMHLHRYKVLCHSRLPPLVLPLGRGYAQGADESTLLQHSEVYSCTQVLSRRRKNMCANTAEFARQ